jgi:fucokinase
MEPFRAEVPPFDWLVLTAANARQAAAYGLQLDARAGHAPFAGMKGAFAIADARDARIGSGAATVLALAEVARRLLRTKRARSLEALFAGERVLILHSGGDSRRLPMHAVEGKIFAPVPVPAPGNRCATVFDILVDDLASLAPREGGEVLVGAGDAVLGLRRDPPRLAGEGVIGVAQRASLERASRHGVFVASAKGGAVRGFLQKPGEREMRAAGAVLGDGRALVDLGLFSFDPRSVAALLAGAGVRLRAGKLMFSAGGLADLASRASIPQVDLYREIAMALPARARRGKYLEACAAGAPAKPLGVLAKPLGALFDAMRGTPFRVVVAEVGDFMNTDFKNTDFLHIGSMREMLDALCGERPKAAEFGVVNSSFPAPPAAVAGRGAVAALDCGRRAAVRIAGGKAVVDACEIGSLELGGANIVHGIDARTLALPRGVALFAVPTARGVAMVACGVDDDFKTPLDEGGTIFGAPFARFLAKAGFRAEDVLEGDRTLWDARLWTIGAARDGRALRWMWSGARAPRAWRIARRHSMRELLAIGDAAAIAERRARMGRLAAIRDPAWAFELAATHGHLDELHRALRAAPREERRALASGAQDPGALLPRRPLPRAYASAALSCAVRELGAAGARRAAEFRAQAFAAVGEAVLSRFELPQRPARAAIMHDQAVWTSTPVRVDLAGGWTDTPPICNAVGGSVVNVAVTLRGQLPIQVVAKLEEEPVIRITSTDLGETRVIRTAADLAHRGDPTRWSSLAENALVLTGAAPSDPKASLAKWLRAVGGGISLTMFSAVPKGSGLGTSSILGAATIQCLDRVFGRERPTGELFAATSALEQMLSTRGGWQDQVGGVLGGFKIARTPPGADQRPVAEPLAVPAAFARELSARSLLYFTGERRMAKNILENVVWNHLTREPSAVEAVHGLRGNAQRMRDALVAGDGDAFAGEVDRYMRLKRQIDPGSSPPMFDALARRWKRELSSWCFAGAGGGGFMLLVARDARAAARLAASIDRDPPHPRARAFPFEVDPVGLRCAVL